MEKNEATEFVIQQLSKQRKRDDIIFELCNRTGRSWDEMASFVRHIEQTHHGDIAARQRPVFVIFGIVFVIGGLILTLSVLISTLDGWIIFVGGIPYAGNIGLIVTGIGLVVGGIVGLWQAFKDMLNK